MPLASEGVTEGLSFRATHLMTRTEVSEIMGEFGGHLGATISMDTGSRRVIIS
ncbi:hypothetical protein FOWG_18243 [Fusarium oxysporum f. sp. lycopersici MN25]|nr:hypothetical protein FOWG_18243 [Fusarium oxysporum f. sp. lycopersici MN25]